MNIMNNNNNNNNNNYKNNNNYYYSNNYNSKMPYKSSGIWGFSKLGLRKSFPV